MDSDIKDLMCQRDKWYGDAIVYWKDVSADLDGMLGGYERISPLDVEASRKFLADLRKKSIWTSGNERGLDCGAGIGRVTKHLLMPMFDHVDLLEQNADFLTAANSYLNENKEKIGSLIPEGVQDFVPREKLYDIIWFQWVVGHLTDDDFVISLQRFKKGLKKGGLICIKDNVAGVEAVFDNNDSSVTRTHEQYVKIFKAAGLTIRLKETQRNLPKELYKVCIIITTMSNAGRTLISLSSFPASMVKGSGLGGLQLEIDFHAIGQSRRQILQRMFKRT